MPTTDLPRQPIRGQSRMRQERQRSPLLAACILFFCRSLTVCIWFALYITNPRWLAIYNITLIYTRIDSFHWSVMQEKNHTNLTCKCQLLTNITYTIGANGNLLMIVKGIRHLSQARSYVLYYMLYV